MKWYGWLGIGLGVFMAIGHGTLGTIDILIPLKETSFTIDNIAGMWVTWHIVTFHLLLLGISFFAFKYLEGTSGKIFGYSIFVQYLAYFLGVLFISIYPCKSLFIMPMWIPFLLLSIISWYKLRAIK